LRKCTKAGFKFEKWQQPDLNLAYDLLFNFRQQKNIPLNISRAGLIKCFELFPNRYHLFTVKDKKEIIGLSVCIEVNSDIFYHFCLSTNPNYFLFSPSVMLYEGIYEYCKAHSFHLFDFGTASIEGKKQEGLFRFKEKLGGIMTLKPTYTKSLL
jgi:lipid II:glycine glycyltransferase (peptidoglycan interpeptide bridge formation enzyme)